MASRALLMVVLTGLFSLRVAGQALQRWAPQAWLPPFADFQGSNLPYPVLLSSQIAILLIMLVATARAVRDVAWTEPHRCAGEAPRRGRPLLVFGAIYMTGSVLRIAIGALVPAAPAWFRAWIPGAFHLVLAGFTLAASWRPAATCAAWRLSAPSPSQRG